MPKKRLHRDKQTNVRKIMRLSFFLIGFMFVVGLIVWADWRRPVEGRVVKVIDGDTIMLDSGETVRYIGVDTPEVSVPLTDLECYGPEATNRNKELVKGRQIKMVRDMKNRDKYGRLLRYVYLTDGTFINMELAKEGYARALSIYPNVSFTREIELAVTDAQHDNKGLWSADNCP